MKINTNPYFCRNYSIQMSYFQDHKLLQTQQQMLSRMFSPGHFETNKQTNKFVTSFITANSYLDRLEIFEIN